MGRGRGVQDALSLRWAEGGTEWAEDSPAAAAEAWDSVRPGLAGRAAAITMATSTTPDERASDEFWTSGAGSGQGLQRKESHRGLQERSHSNQSL